jgi:hypothetical protein
MGLERSAPGVQDTSATREVGADAPLVLGEAFAGERRGVDHGVGREAWMCIKYLSKSNLIF